MLLERLDRLQALFRPTPIASLEMEGIALHAKLEYFNPIGSIKDRTAFWILKRAAERGEIEEGSTVIESSSGNFAVALAALARLSGLRFIPVVDPHIAGLNESILRRLCADVVRVDEPDETGGYLKTRLKKVQELLATIPRAYWPNQYGNPDGMDAHYRLTGGEICDSFDRLDYVFVGVSTAGTIAGVSRRVKERFPDVRVIAVDAEGSAIFGGQTRRRHIPGIGASIAPDLLRHALIDDVVMIPETETVDACSELIQRHGLFAGGSSGTLYAAVKRYLPKMVGTRPVVLFFCADRGTGYLDMVYDEVWTRRLRE